MRVLSKKAYKVWWEEKGVMKSLSLDCGFTTVPDAVWAAASKHPSLAAKMEAGIVEAFLEAPKPAPAKAKGKAEAEEK